MSLAYLVQGRLISVVTAPTSRGVFRTSAGLPISRQSLPEDPVGVFALTLSNLVVGSAIQVESVSGVTLYNGTAASSSQLINLQTYAAGSPLNSLVIKVRKGSEAPYYQPYRTETTAIVGAQSIYVSQIKD